MNESSPTRKWRGADYSLPNEPPQINIREHQQTYRYFVIGAVLFAANCLAILAILAFVFSDNFV